LIIATAVIAAWATWRERRLPSTPGLEIAGVQLEFPAEPVILEQLDHLIQVHPKAQLIVLSEYSFDGPIPGAVRDWCRSRGKYLIAGGKHWLTGGQYYNTAYVIGPDGQVQFEQAKAQPIQFFHDGLPAPRQQVWQSPWGPIGILICYDLSYARVVDELVRQGARLIIAPTMDVRNWGEHEHELNARTAPLRAAEYGIPIFRLCSSGISQIVAADGTVLASAPFPGQRAMIQGRINLDSRPALPLDRILGPVCALGIVLLTVWLLGSGLTNRVRRHFKTNSGFLC
jgi:apolipoprotein N-acyltransferase